MGIFTVCSFYNLRKEKKKIYLFHKLKTQYKKKKQTEKKINIQNKHEDISTNVLCGVK